MGKEYSKPQWQAIFRQMMGHDLVRPDPERHGALRMTETAKPILKGEADIRLRRDSIRKAARRPAVKAMVSDEDAPLLSALKAAGLAMVQYPEGKGGLGAPPKMNGVVEETIRQAGRAYHLLGDMSEGGEPYDRARRLYRKCIVTFPGSHWSNEAKAQYRDVK